MKLSLKLAVTVILVGVIVWQLGGLGKVGASLRQIDPAYISLIFALYTLDRALMSYKWGLLLRSRGQQLPFFRGLRLYCASMVWGMFLPTTVGADAIRALSTSRCGLDADEVVASIVIERMIGFITALGLGLLSFFVLSVTGGLDERFRPLWWLGSLILLGATLAFTASLSERGFDFVHSRLSRRFSTARILQRLRQAHLSYVAYRREKRSLVTFFGLTIVQQLTPILLIWLTARALSVEVSLLYVTGVVPVVFLISRVPISINTLGVFEGIFIFVMSLVGVTAAESIAIALAGRLLEVASWLPWWLAHIIGYGGLQASRLVAHRG
jgi:glycosyltransferase 2 family protein